MNAFRVFCCRTYQKCLFMAQKAIRFPIPEVLSGGDALKDVPTFLESKKAKKPLILATPSSIRHGSIKLLTGPLEEKGFSYGVFTGIVPNPPFKVIDEAYRAYLENGCDCLIALGGGSCIDAAKALGVKIAYPKSSLSRFKGVLKVHRKIPLLIAIPTTAGSGSEATIASVVVDEANKDKFAINDPHLVPSLAVLDPELLTSLPPDLIAATGMDALTHAIESFIGGARTSLTKDMSLKAMALIRDNLVSFFNNPKDKACAEAMQKAAFFAGISFTRGYVGYVHALAHALGGYYGVAHGYANAVLLPIVLEGYGEKAEKKLAEAAEFLELSSSKNRHEAAASFISWVKSLNLQLGIPSGFKDLIKEEDVPSLAKHAYKEANPLYPVPKEMDEGELAALLKEAEL